MTDKIKKVLKENKDEISSREDFEEIAKKENLTESEIEEVFASGIKLNHNISWAINST